MPIFCMRQDWVGNTNPKIFEERQDSPGTTHAVGRRFAPWYGRPAGLRPGPKKKTFDTDRLNKKNMTGQFETPELEQ